MRLGRYYFNGGAYDLEKALRAYESALTLNPDIRLAHYQIARIHFLRGDFYRALEEINKELVLHPEIPNSYYVRGLINGYAGRFSEAEADFMKFIDLVPWQWAGYNDLAWVLAKQGRFKEVRDMMDLAFERLPGAKMRNPWLWTTLGIAQLNLKDYNEAKDAFLNARALSDKMSAEDFWSAYPGNDPRGAEPAFQQFRAALHFNLGIVYEKLGELEKAKEAYHAYLSLLPKDPFLQLPQRNEIKRRILKLNAYDKK
jgi:tetratricopeptide (TPR) repeat protein